MNRVKNAERSILTDLRELERARVIAELERSGVKIPKPMRNKAYKDGARVNKLKEVRQALNHYGRPKKAIDLLKQTGKAAALATSISFMMILAFYEYINFVLDPLILDLSNGVPVFSIFSKVLLGLILLPLERFINSLLDKIASKVKLSNRVLN